MKTPTHTLNRRTFVKRGALAALVAPSLAPSAVSAAAGYSEARVRVAVVTSGHSYDVPNFHRLFRALPGAEADIQHMDDFASSPETVRDQYDVVLFYIMLMDGPTDEKLPWYAGKPKTALEHLGATQQGIVVLHHALLAYPQWSVWSEIVGIADRKFGFHYNQTIQVQVANTEHPITRGLKSWAMVDETYTMADAGDGSDILLTVEHPKSMKTLAWTRTYKKSRVLCFESGHDNAGWSNASFREVLGRGIQWCGRRS
jgi:uncharacterized protein